MEFLNDETITNEFSTNCIKIFVPFALQGHNVFDQSLLELVRRKRCEEYGLHVHVKLINVSSEVPEKFLSLWGKIEEPSGLRPLCPGAACTDVITMPSLDETICRWVRRVRFSRQVTQLQCRRWTWPDTVCPRLRRSTVVLGKAKYSGRTLFDRNWPSARARSRCFITQIDWPCKWRNGPESKTTTCARNFATPSVRYLRQDRLALCIVDSLESLPNSGSFDTNGLVRWFVND